MKRGLVVLICFVMSTAFSVSVKAQPKNVFSVTTSILGIRSFQNTTQFSLNGDYWYEYDRQLAPLISIAPMGTLQVFSGGNQTLTSIRLGTALRFWVSKKFSGFYVGPGINISILSGQRGSTTMFSLFGDLGYRFLIKNVALSLGGQLGFAFAQGTTGIVINGVLSMGYAF